MSHSSPKVCFFFPVDGSETPWLVLPTLLRVQPAPLASATEAQAQPLDREGAATAGSGKNLLVRRIGPPQLPALSRAEGQEEGVGGSSESERVRVVATRFWRSVKLRKCVRRGAARLRRLTSRSSCSVLHFTAPLSFTSEGTETLVPKSPRPRQPLPQSRQRRRMRAKKASSTGSGKVRIPVPPTLNSVFFAFVRSLHTRAGRRLPSL